MKFALSAASIGLSLLMSQTTQATELKAFVTGAARAAYETITPQFERDTGHKLVTHFDLPPAVCLNRRFERAAYRLTIDLPC